MSWYYTEPRPRRRPLDPPAGTTTGGGGGGPPTGPAGGDLTGSYPNPTIAPGAVGNAEITDVAYAKVTGAPAIPTTLPPSGPAGGDLSGSYPNPEIKTLAVGTPELADGAVTDAKMTSVAYAKVTGAPTALPPSGTASGDLTGSYPGPTIAAGAVTTTKLGDAPNGVTTAKLNDGAVTNAKIADVAWGKVTGAPTSFPPSGGASGDLGGTYPGPTVAKVNGAAVGTTTPLARGDLLVANATPALVRLARGTVNQVLQSNGTDVVWGAAPATGGPPTGAAGGSLTGTYPNPTIAPNAITAGMVKVKEGQRNVWAPPVPVNWVIPTKNAFVVFVSQAMTVAGATILALVDPHWTYNIAGAASEAIAVQLNVDGTNVYFRGYDLSGSAGWMPFPGFSTLLAPAAGAHTLTIELFCTTNATVVAPNRAGQAGTIYFLELL